MKTERTNCPRCNSLQSFIPSAKVGEDGIGVVTISCKPCGWTKVLGHTTSMIEQARRRERQWLVKYQQQVDRHGRATQTTHDKLQAAVHHRIMLERELQRRIDATS